MHRCRARVDGIPNIDEKRIIRSMICQRLPIIEHQSGAREAYETEKKENKYQILFSKHILATIDFVYRHGRTSHVRIRKLDKTQL